MFSEPLSLVNAFIISGFSITMVFLVLLAISFIVDINAMLLRKATKKNEPLAKPQTPSVAQKSDSALPQNDRELTAQKVVLITAALAAYLQTNQENIIVRKITPVSSVPSNWEMNSLNNLMRH